MVGRSAERVVLDGDFGDWTGRVPAHRDPVGDGAALDLGELWLAHDERYLFVRFAVGAEISLQEGNELALHLDADDDPSTGSRALPGVGAEVVWKFGDKTGRLRGDGLRGGRRRGWIGSSAIGLVTAPTVSSAVFEVAVDRTAVEELALGSGAAGRPSPSWRVALATPGDRLPDAGTGVRYTFDPARAEPPFVPRPPGRALERADPEALRILTYNVERDGLLDPELRPVFDRLLAAVGPDLVGFQEVYAHGAEPVRRAVAEALPGSRWHAAKVGLDLVAVSRFPIERAVCIADCDDFGSTGAFLVDAREALGRRLLFVVAHPPCCTGGDPPADRERQRVIDETMAFVRDVGRPSSPLVVEAGTPIVVAGDLNLVGDRRQLRTLLTGDLADDRLGPDFAPDWDGTDLADLRPLHTHAPMAYTWIRERGPFGPGRLDYVIYTDSVLRAVSGFVLHTPEMPPAALTAAGLQAGDTPRASDHLPVVGDFVVR